MAQQPVTTIPPFADTKVLPACAANCGPLYDANGACVPPAAAQAEASVYTGCFCSHNGVKALSTATAGVCDDACQGNDLSSIAGWFRDMCKVKNDNGNNGGDNNGGDNNGGDNKGDDNNQDQPAPTGKPVNHNNGGGDWISNHWKWVVMLAVLVVAIAGIWIAACIWRRRYLKKRELAMPLKPSPPAAPWAPDATVTTRPTMGSSTPSDDPRGAGSFMPGSQTTGLPEAEKASNSRWGR